MSRASVMGSRTVVGKYELGRTLGEGSFAKVKFARNTQTTAESPVAIKIIDRHRVLSHHMVEQAKYGKLKEGEARSYFQQLINAVDYCHSRGVYHRDLKPENLLLDSNGVLKVSDFGLSAFSKQVGEDGLLHTACGTPNYVAPEVLNDKGYDGTTSDVWSCGVILFVLMAGYLPFDEPNLMALYRKIHKADFSFPPWFSSKAKKLIKRILDPNPLTRITIAEILENDWFKKDYKQPRFKQEEDVNVDDVDAVFNDSEDHLVTERKEKPVSMNAFALISRSQGFSLENLFDKQMMMKLQGYKSGRKGQLAVATEVFEVAPSLHMVELRKTGGDTLEFHKACQYLTLSLLDSLFYVFRLTDYLNSFAISYHEQFYKTFSSGLKDIVWTSDSNKEETS
ncbi:CBL-interacting protein kinase 9 [Dorcoceras hygrometricum]|uniref:non-specific serine/threonine protein kinase n=1 Tax=Dorcoceras hygrometricum TaxID=472368 RepID=A0A2Z7D1J9_9LAMI|nr:CBL-interacting protein kinase 9 [Dorcoceras hygrometricum]